MKTQFSLFLLLVSIISYSQNNSSIHFLSGLESKLKLDSSHISLRPSFQDYKGQFYYRIFTENQIIDLYVSDTNELFSESLNCIVYNWTEEILVQTEKTTPFTYIQNVIYYTIVAEQLFFVLDSLKINEIPSFEEINGWKKNEIHNEVLYIESKENGIYKLRSFPGFGFNLDNSYGYSINKFIERMTELLGLKNSWGEFIKAIPVECYQNLSVYSYCKPLTKRERRKLNRSRKEFDNHHHDRTILRL